LPPLPSPAEKSAGLASISGALQGSYSTQLYGAPGLCDISSMNFLWLALLSNATLHALNRVGVFDAASVCPTEHGCWQSSTLRQHLAAPLLPIGTLYKHHSFAFEPMDSVWIRRVNSPVPSHGWVEVTHCADPDGVPPGDTYTPLWFYVARGSGLWLNVGSTLVVDEEALINAHIASLSVPDVSDEIMRFWQRGENWLARTYGILEVGKIDSVQRVLHHEQDTTLDHHEIALAPSPLLRNEVPFVTALNSTRLRCGSWPQNLRQCSPSDLAIRQLALGCAGRPAGLSKRVAQNLQLLSAAQLSPAAHAAHAQLSPAAPASRDETRPRRIAWFHPPKCGTSFGTTLVHYANRSLAADVGMPLCGADGKLCSGATGDFATGDFFDRFPLNQWFPGVFWEKDGDPGAHRAVTETVLKSFDHAFFGMFRDPSRRVQSEFVYQDLRQNSSVSMAYTIIEYAQHVAGMMTKMLAGQEDGNDCRTPGRECQPHLVPDVHKAIERLSTFRFVGLTDSWEESICLFHLQLGGECLLVEQVNTRETDMQKQPHVHNATLQELLQKVDPYDTSLYNAAVRKFRANAAAAGLTCERCQAISCPCGSLGNLSANHPE